MSHLHKLYIPGKIVHIRRRKEARFGSEKKRNETEIPEAPLDENKSRSRRDSTVEAMSKHIPGTSKTSYTLHYTTHTISNEMLLTKTCIEDHMIASYQNVFEVLREQYPSPYGSIH
jgi:hypothetical protein